ncbi:MAG: sensor histidine kinase [Acidobacteria bacterium]|nr:MAG: sensor histidine kinase [Acidobacteriota bacterium]
MKLKKQNLVGGFNRYRLVITLGLAVLLPAAALIYVNFSQLRSFQRDKVLEALIRRDFQEALALYEKKMNKAMYKKVDETRELFPSADADVAEKEHKLDEILSRCSCLTHAFIFDGDDVVFQTQPSQRDDKYVRDERDHMVDSYHAWFSTKTEMKTLVETLHQRPLNIGFNSFQTTRADGPGFLLTGLFFLPADDRTIVAGVTFDPCYMKSEFLPNMLDDFVKEKNAEQSGNSRAMMIYRADQMDGREIKPMVATVGWGEGKPEVTRKLDDVFHGLALGIKFEGTSVEAMGHTWIRNSFIILGFLSLMIVGGLVLTKHMVSKEMAVAKLKSDFVSNVSHELRTPLALIRLYAETLELGRITTQEKKHQYYRIIRKESERLTALINNILDFSRIEAGHKEYEFRETDIADLVRNTLDSYRYQIEQQGFALEEAIDSDLPAVRVDREAIARALVNLVNNALKYSQDEKYLGVKLYRDNGSVKLEVADRGIGIARRDQAKIFEKFYRAGDPLVHNTKGSGLGLSLVRHITEAHGGEIEVESSPGTGSKFIMSLPLVAAPPQVSSSNAIH